jgi:hypothetical protein
MVTLAATSLSSPTVPAPLHVLLPRQSYLHLGLLSAVQRLHPFAPVVVRTTTTTTGGGGGGDSGSTLYSTTTTSSSGRTMIRREEPELGEVSGHDDDDDKAMTNQGTSSSAAAAAAASLCPVCWFQDEETQLPLRWHLFAGVLYDLHNNTTTTRSGSSSSSNTSRCTSVSTTTTATTQHQPPESTTATYLPWRLILHFTNYPDPILLPLSTGQVEGTIRAMFANSLKQAVTLRTGQSAVQLLTKEMQETLWHSIHSSSCTTTTSTGSSLYRQVTTDLASKLTPISTTTTTNGGGVGTTNHNKTSRIPVRLLVVQNAGTVVTIQKSCPASSTRTLFQLLQLWLSPQQQQSVWLVPANNNNTDTAATGTLRLLQKRAGVAIKINGIEPPLETYVWDLWDHLRHADYFLYVTVVVSLPP